MSTATLEVWRAPGDSRGVDVAPDFVAIVRSPRLAGVLERCLAQGATVVAAIEARALCGYATVVPSSALTEERWRELPALLELGAIEVARSARRRGIARSLLAQIPAALDLRSRVLMARGVTHHWDFEDAGLSRSAYRSLLMRLLHGAGMTPWPTDDPEVREDPLNFLSARIGEEASSEVMGAFFSRLG